MTPVRKVTPSNVASIGHSNGVTLSPSDTTLARELVQFAVEQLTETLHVAGRKPIARQLERYRDDAAELLERLRQ